MKAVVSNELYYFGLEHNAQTKVRRSMVPA
jgi:hypothetical protein